MPLPKHKTTYSPSFEEILPRLEKVLSLKYILILVGLILLGLELISKNVKEIPNSVCPLDYALSSITYLLQLGIYIYI